MPEIINSIANLLKEFLPAILSLTSIILSLSLGLPALYLYRNRFRQVRLEILQTMLDEVLAVAKDMLGDDVRATVMLREGDKLKPVLVRPAGSESSVDSISHFDMEGIGRITTQNKLVWYAPTVEGKMHPHLRSLLSVPIFNKEGETAGIIVVDGTAPFTPDSGSLNRTVISIERITRKVASLL
jgi:hypothetical protein